MDDLIKSAFQKVKQEVDSLREQVSFLTSSLSETNKKMSESNKIIQDLLLNLSNLSPPQNFPPLDNPAHNQTNPTFFADNPAQNTPKKPQNTQNLTFSTGNEGVPADRQADRQADQQIKKTTFSEAADILDSLDILKKEIRIKFKRITEQEFLVFSAIYQLSEETGFTDYKTVSSKLNLTESSIRDYVVKLIKKGIPIEKKRINNKIIHLFVSENLKKVVSLPTILQLRSL